MLNRQCHLLTTITPFLNTSRCFRLVRFIKTDFIVSFSWKCITNHISMKKVENFKIDRNILSVLGSCTFRHSKHNVKQDVTKYASIIICLFTFSIIAIKNAIFNKFYWKTVLLAHLHIIFLVKPFWPPSNNLMNIVHPLPSE